MGILPRETYPEMKMPEMLDQKERMQKQVQLEGKELGPTRAVNKEI